jgi:hypothetical protein
VRRLKPATVDVRAGRMEKLRMMIELHGNLAPITPWHTELSQLEAGVPVEVYGWQLPLLARPNGPNGRFRIERDGSVTPLAGAQP